MGETNSYRRTRDIERLIGWMIVAIIVFSGAAFLLLINTEVNADCSPQEPLALGQRFMEAVRCMTPNELGDTLAGLFAPLAFVGLIISVLYQRRDLALQREEMALTREEMERARDVMNKQRDEAEASANALQAQAQAMAAQNEKMQADRAIAGFGRFYQNNAGAGRGKILESMSRTINANARVHGEELGGVIRRVAAMPELQPNILDEQLREGEINLLAELRLIDQHVSDHELKIQCRVQRADLHRAIEALERGIAAYHSRMAAKGGS